MSCTDSAWEMPPTFHTLASRAWSARGYPDFWQYCLVAEGTVDVGCDPVMALWDYAGVRLIIEEAGGRCTTFAGGEPAHCASFLATNGLVHDEASRILTGA